VRELQQVLVDDPPAVFLAWRESTRAVRRHLAIPSQTDRDVFPSLPRWTRADEAQP
jgi:hypothetical protein